MSDVDYVMESARTLTGDELIELQEQVTLLLKNHPWPALSVERVTDDGETYDALRCAVCGLLVGEEDLGAVDEATRWTFPESDGFDFERSRVAFGYDDRGDFGDTLYYMHYTGDNDHRVSLPEGWRER